MWWSYFCLSVVMVGVKARVKKEEQQTATNIMVENVWDCLNDFLTYALDCSPSGWSSWDWAGAWLRHQRPHGPTPLNEPRGKRVNVVEIAQRIFSSRKARNSGEFVSASNRPQRIRFIVYICKLSNCWKFLLSLGRLSEVPMTLKLTEDRNLVLFLGFAQLQMIWQVHKGLHV